MLKFKIFVLKTFLFSRRMLKRAISLNNQKLKQKISQVLSGRGQSGQLADTDLFSQLFFASSFKVTSKTRQEILEVTMEQSLAGLQNSDLNLKVLDASPDEFVDGNKAIFKKFFGIQTDYRLVPKKMPEAFLELFSETAGKYCGTLFDDVPFFGLNKEFLISCCKFLDDFSGLVDIICFETVGLELKGQDHKIIFDLNNHNFKKMGESPLGVVKYGDYSFAIFENYYYGFSLLNFIAPREDYTRRLKWYVEHISSVSPQLIEMASMWFRGPAYNYIAIPLEVFFMDLDFEHTDTTLRGYNPALRELFLALKNRYTVSIKK